MRISDAEARVPAEFFHPTVYLQEEMDARGWDRGDLAQAMGGPSWVANLLTLDLYFAVGPTNVHCRFGEDTARQFGVAFGVSSELFLNLERAWLDGQSCA